MRESDIRDSTNGKNYGLQQTELASSYRNSDKSQGLSANQIYSNRYNSSLGKLQQLHTHNTAKVRPSNFDYLPKPRPSSASDIEKAERLSQDKARILMPPPAPVSRRDLASSWLSKSQSHIQEKNKENVPDTGNPWQLHRTNNEQRFRGFGDGRASIASTSALDGLAGKQFESKEAEDAVASPSGRRGARRRDSRRHTLSNGIDFNTIKRLKQLEKEKDSLLQGLEAVDEARDWYIKQIAVVDERIKSAGKGVLPNDYSMEAHQEHMNFLAARITELNQQIRALVDSSHKGFPLHMNLAMSQAQRQEPSEAENIIAMLKAQNKMLTQEVNQKTEKISQLEREKSTLVREVFETRTNKNSTYNDTTFL